MIADHIQNTKQNLLGFIHQFEIFKKVSLPTVAELEQRMTKENQSYIKELIYRCKSEMQEEYVWDPVMIQGYVEKIENLNKQLDNVEASTRTINKRQEALGVKPTDFPELYSLKAAIKPLV